MSQYPETLCVIDKYPAMEHHQSWKISAIVGFIGGMGKYLFIDAPTFPVRFMEATVTALGCGVAGALGKYLFDLLRPVVLAWLKRNFHA